jgi:hypothetical protein
VNDDFVAELAAGLDSLGVGRADAARVLEEARDHLEQAAAAGGEDPIRRFGDAATFARLVAAELATSRTRRATFTSFAVLALAGSVYVLAFALVPAAGGWPDLFGGRVAALGPILALPTILLPQIAFVAGCLALIRAVRLGASSVVGATELRLLRRRSNLALAATAGALAALAVYAVGFRGELAAWWTWSTVAACAVLATPLVLAARKVADSACPAAASVGEESDVFDDLAPVLGIRPLRSLRLEEHPWRFALLSAAIVGAGGFGAGWYAEGDPGSGLVRGGFEALALLICFAALGRTLGLRPSKRQKEITCAD